MERYQFQTEGMGCKGCEQLIKRKVGDIDTTEEISVDNETGVIEFTVADSTTGSYIEHLIWNLGYEITAVDIKEDRDM